MHTKRHAAAIALFLLIGFTRTDAQTHYWGSDTTGDSTAGATSWQDTSHWFTDATGVTGTGTSPGLGDDAVYSITSLNGTALVPRIFANTEVNSLTFNNTPALNLTGSGNRTLDIGAGGVTANGGSVTLGTSAANQNVFPRFRADQTWTNNGTGTLLIRNSAAASDSAAGDVVVTFNAASSGTISNSGSYSDGAAGSLGLIIDSAGTGNVGMSSSLYSGGTLVKRGLLSSSGQIGSGTILLGDTSGSNDARINLTGTASANIIVQANPGSGLTALTGSGSGNYQGTITMNRDLAIGSVSSSGQTIAFSGAISGAGNLTIGRVATGSSNPTVTLSNANNSYTGKTTIASATAVVSKLSNAGVNSNFGAASGANGTITMSTVSSSTLRYNGTGDTTNRDIEIAAAATLEQAGSGHLLLSGNVNSINLGSSRTLTLRGATAGTAEISGIINNIGGGNSTGLTKTDSGTWTLSNVANTYTGTTSITGGILEVSKLSNGGVASSIGMSSNSSGNLSFGGGTLRYVGTGDSTDRLMNVGALGGGIDASGSGPLSFTNTGAFSVSTSTTSRTFTLSGSNMGANTLGTDLNDPSGSATLSIAKSGTGRWVLTNSNNYTGPTTVSAGTLSLSGGTNNSASFVVAAGANFEQSGTDWSTDLFHSAGSGSSLDIAQLADSTDGSSEMRFTLSPGSGISAVNLTDADPFSQLLGGAGEWASEWEVTFDLANITQTTDFVALNIMSSSSYDLGNLDGVLRMVTTDGNGVALPASAVSNGQVVFLAKAGNVVSQYQVSFTENSVDLVFLSARAIPEPTTLGMVALALLILRRRMRS